MTRCRTHILGILLFCWGILGRAYNGLLSFFSVWRAVISYAILFPPLIFVCQTEKQLRLLSHSYSMAWFEYCFNTSSEKLSFSFSFMHVIFKGLLNFKMSFCHISRLLFFHEKIHLWFDNRGHRGICFEMYSSADHLFNNNSKYI